MKKNNLKINLNNFKNKNQNNNNYFKSNFKLFNKIIYYNLKYINIYILISNNFSEKFD